MNVVFNRAKRKGFEHGRKQPCIAVLKQVGRGRHQCRLTSVYSSLIGKVSQNVFRNATYLISANLGNLILCASAN